MVLPEIEEEEDEDNKLSLTSLLLGRDDESSPLGYDRSPAIARAPRLNPGAWRNGHTPGSLRSTVLTGSVDSLGPGEEEEMALEEARRDSNQSERGSIGLSNRRGSRLQDIIQIQGRRGDGIGG